jgi:hypothetical protein
MVTSMALEAEEFAVTKVVVKQIANKYLLSLSEISILKWLARRCLNVISRVVGMI